MAFESAQFGRVLVVRWTGAPTLVDLKRLNNLIVRTYRDVGERLLYVASVPHEHDTVPGPDVRALMMSQMKSAVTTQLDSIDLVLSRPGVRGTMQRAGVRTMGVLAGMGRKFFIHQSMASAMARVRANVSDPGTLKRIEAVLEPFRA